jgi:SRSO17 transposase
VENHRWSIEYSFETAKNEFRLDHNETGLWHGWHRHVSVVMMAFGMMAPIRRQAKPSDTEKCPSAETKRSHPLVEWRNGSSSATSSQPL